MFAMQACPLNFGDVPGMKFPGVYGDQEKKE